MASYKAQLIPEIDFVDVMTSDFDKLLRDELRANGYDPDVIAAPMELAAAYGGLCARRITSKPRRVHEAPNLIINTSVREGYANLKKKFINGDNINPHLSKLSARTDSVDHLFFDWGINHFHLGTAFEKDGFIKRSGPVAFAIVKENDVYIIAIDLHGTWTNTSMLEIIDANWPELIQPALVDGELTQQFSNENLKELRKANINVGVQLPNGHIYISPGGGYQTTGISSLAVIETLRMKKYYRDLHHWCEANLTIEADPSFIAQHGTILNIHLMREGEDLILTDTIFNFRLPILKFRSLPV